MGLFSKTKRDVPDDGQMELVEHLAELRNRIIRTVLYVFVGMVLTYNIFPFLYRLLFAPAYMVLGEINQKHGIDARPVFSGIQDAFLLRLETSLFAGLVLALPLLVWEIWGFVRPALTPTERAPVKFLAPFAGLLLVAGLGTGYGALPTAYGWMSQFVSDISGATLLQDAKQYLLLTVKILAAFGIAFQLPVLLLFLARVGVINSRMMVTYWRHAVFLIFFASAMFVPTADPATMLLMAAPLAGLYMMSIVLVKVFEPGKDGTPRNDFLPKLLIALVPILLLSAVGTWLWIKNPPKQAAATVDLFQTQQSVTKLAERMEKLEKQTEGATPSPDQPTLEQRVETSETSLAETKQKIDELANRIAELTAQLEALQKRLPAQPVANTSPAPPAGATR